VKEALHVKAHQGGPQTLRKRAANRIKIVSKSPSAKRMARCRVRLARSGRNCMGALWPRWRLRVWGREGGTQLGLVAFILCV
jgi:hypothetical protein